MKQRKKSVKNQIHRNDNEKIIVQKFNYPSISLKYLADSNYCLSNVAKHFKHNHIGHINFINVFQEFIRDFSSCSNIGEAIQRYSSHKNGSKKAPGKVVSSVKRMFDKQQNNIVLDELQHLHLKRFGKGKEVLWGYVEEDTFYIPLIDVEHITI